MIPSSKMSHIDRDLLESIRGNSPSLAEFGRALANLAEPDFSLQSDVSAEDLVLPLKIGRFPDEGMFASSSQLFEVFELWNFVACQYAAGFENDPLSELYVAAVILAGIVRHQRPEAAEFGIAGNCLVLLRASRALASVPKEVVASFVNDLKRHVIRDPVHYWNATWVIVSLLATALALTSRLSVRSDLEKELAGFLCSVEWESALAEQRSEDTSDLQARGIPNEVQAMEVLLGQCGITLS